MDPIKMWFSTSQNNCLALGIHFLKLRANWKAFFFFFFQKTSGQIFNINLFLN